MRQKLNTQTLHKKKGSSPHIHISKDLGGGWEPAPQLSGAATISSSLCVLAALREDLGCEEDGAFAPEAWVPSARRPYPIFRFARIRVIRRSAPERQRTAVATTELIFFVAAPR